MKLLVYTPHGSIELYATGTPGSRRLWTSDQDAGFMEEFEDVIRPDEDHDDVIDYLIEEEFLQDGEEIDVDEQYLDDEHHITSGPGDDEDDDGDDDGDDE